MEPRSSQIFDLVFRASDFLKTEIELVGNEDYVPGDVDDIVELLTESKRYQRSDRRPGRRGGRHFTGMPESRGRKTGLKVSQSIQFEFF